MRPNYSIAIALIALALAGEGRAAVNLSFNGTTTLLPGLVVAPPPTAPAAPLSSVLGPKTSATMTLVWSDGSTNEAGYRIERQDGTTWTVVAQLPPVGTSVIGFGTTHKVTGLTHNTRYCLRVVPYNSVGSTPGPSLCATTPRITNAITVVVSDLQGLQGELEDLTPLAYQSMATVTAQLAATPAFPVPAARKIVYVADSASIRIPPGAKVHLQAGVHLVSGRRGVTRGALLYTDATFATEMIQVVGDGVRISGLRLRGPSAGTSQDLAKVIGVLARNVLDVVVDHCEVYNWTGAGVELRHDPGTVHAMTAQRVRITENYFHHNQSQGGGYGVSLRDASYAWIEANTFDWNRHAITADGGGNVIVPGYGPEQGYFAYRNVVLPGHSEQDGLGPFNYETHHFEVRGTESGTVTNSNDGWAGEFFEVAHNSFLALEELAFKVRGTPSDAAYFQHNVSGHIEYDAGTHGYAVDDESDRDNVVNYWNTNVPDPRGRLGVGDFDGDGRDDVFLATSKSWYVSYGGITEWRFLNNGSLAISELSLLDHDGDGRTDVLSRQSNGTWLMWRGGAGMFTALATTPVVPAQNFYSGTDLIGDFSGDEVLDRLSFDRSGDRYLRTIDGRTGAAGQSRHQM